MNFIELQLKTKAFNLSEIERQLNIPRGFISKHINGHQELSIKHLEKLNDYLNKNIKLAS